MCGWVVVDVVVGDVEVVGDYDVVEVGDGVVGVEVGVGWCVVIVVVEIV